MTQIQTITCSECGAQMPADSYARIYGRCARHADEERERGMSHPAFGDIRLPFEDRPPSPPQSREDKLRAALESYVALHGMSVLAKEALEAE